MGLFIFILLIICILPRSINAKCDGKLAVKPFSEHGQKFDESFCKVFGSILSNYDDPEQIFIKEKSQFCSCIHESEKCSNVHNLSPTDTKQCPKNKICCLPDEEEEDEEDDDDDFECPDQESRKSNKNFNESTYDDLKCVHSYKRNESSFIVGVIDKRGRVRCGGVIIHPQVIVTNSDCLNSTSSKIEYVKTSNKFESRHIHSFITDYKAKYHVALLHLKTPLNFTSNLVQPACLPPRQKHDDSDQDSAPFENCATCRAYTWPISLDLKFKRRVKNKQISLKMNSYCKKQLGTKDEHKYQNLFNICAGFTSENLCKEVGLGKSGMPVLCQLEGRPEGHLNVAGFSSTFARCDTDQPVAYFTRLPINWIHEEVKNTWGYDLL